MTKSKTIAAIAALIGREARRGSLGTLIGTFLLGLGAAISRGLARYLEDVEGFDRESFEIVHYGIEPDGEPPPACQEIETARCVRD